MAVDKAQPMEVLSSAVMMLHVSPPDSEDTIAPEEVLTFLARLRLLQGVPFNNIVPDAELLPHESIRFFYLDRAWTDAIVQGALSVATGNTIERAQLERLYPQIEKEIDAAERQVRAPGGEPELTGDAGLVTGFLMRSAAVAGWPGMHIRAYSQPPDGSATEVFPEDHPNRIKLLRLERLSPSVLLCLFDGVPKVLHIEEPRQGIQFGYNLNPESGGRFSASVPARHVRSSNYVNAAGAEQEDPNDAAQISVQFRRKAPGVLDLTNTARNFADIAATGMSLDGKVDGAEFAMQMIRFPFRKIFAHNVSTTATQNDAFKPSIGDITTRYTAELKARIEGS